MSTQAAELVEQFKTEAGRAGFVVYGASNPEDADNYILKLAHEHDVKSVVISNSKVADDIKLRGHLERAGIEVKETDLKLWLAQLAGGNQAECGTIGQVEKLISKAAGKKLDPEPQVLLNAANRVIRQYCIDADLGVSEADLAIAETGTLIILGNEGVTRLVAVLPRMHVTLLEDKNIVSVMEDVFIKLKKVTGDRKSQVVPSYVTYITGRNTTADIPGAVLARAQGPAEEHIILMNRAANGSTT